MMSVLELLKRDMKEQNSKLKSWVNRIPRSPQWLRGQILKVGSRYPKDPTTTTRPIGGVGDHQDLIDGGSIHGHIFCKIQIVRRGTDCSPVGSII